MTGETADGTDESSGLTIESLPKGLQSSHTKLVYLYLHAATEAGLDDIEESLGMGSLTLFPILRVLIDHGLVERIDGRYVTTGEGG